MVAVILGLPFSSTSRIPCQTKRARSIVATNPPFLKKQHRRPWDPEPPAAG
jgi:hypothetical protein